MESNPIRKLAGFGQSVWLDYLRRNLIASGELQRLIEEDGLQGVTSNPSIFEKAIDGSRDYDEDIRLLAREGRTAEDIHEALAVADIQAAADLFRPAFDQLAGREGFVSLEVSPRLAHDTEGTVAEARRLWAAVARPNLFIKIPATREGLPAIQKCIREGININVTLLFGLSRYREVAEAYLAGLEERDREGKPLVSGASVASFFLSRIDVLLDPRLEKAVKEGGAKAGLASRLRGEAAIASAKLAYQFYLENFRSDRFRRLAEKGAGPQRVLWASTSTKNPAYQDVKYVEALIGPDTVNTMPLETLNAYRDHGKPAARLERDLEKARAVLGQLAEAGIDLERAAQQLEDEGVEKFEKAFDRLLASVERKRQAALSESLDRQGLELGGWGAKVEARLARFEKSGFVERLWRKDPTLWTSGSEDGRSIHNSLGWLHVAEKMAEALTDLRVFVAEVLDAGFRHVVLLGMGGSSLTPMVLERTFGTREGGLPLTVLDTTDPRTIREIETGVPLQDTLFMVASKSGTTTEPLAFGDYFYARVKETRVAKAGGNFVAITDPGTPLVKLARERGFRRTFLNFADIGGRYSALSYFGLVPAALMGLDVTELLERALRMVHACASCVPARDNPGVVLGATLAELAMAGRDKVTFILSEPIRSLGLWLEQLLAESTGKDGKGLVPVVDEPLGDPSSYGEDRLFVFTRLDGEHDPGLDEAVAALGQTGHPLITIRLQDRYDLAQEFFRWEVATATAGSILGINAFNQPNVQESKENAQRLLEEMRQRGGLPQEEAALSTNGIRVYADVRGANLTEGLRNFLGQVHPGDYVALLAYLTENGETRQRLEQIRKRLRDRLRRASTLGYGPRYLHSTGQLHKGGPDEGVFLELVEDERQEDRAIPGADYGFEALKQAQAIGDFEALRKRRRRIMRIHLGGNVDKGLELLDSAIGEALG